MTARDEIRRDLTTPKVRGVHCTDEGADALLDAYRAEVLAEAKHEVVAWLVKKARESSTWDAGVLASKIDRGAVRIFLDTVHFRDAMDAHRAKVLHAAADALDASERLRDLTDDHMHDVHEAANELRRMADTPEGER